MEIYGYTTIAFSPFILIIIVFLAIAFICLRKGKLHDLVDFIVFNVFPDILKSKKDDRNQTMVYFRKEKVLLMRERLSLSSNWALMMISLFLILYVVYAFGQIAFVEYSYDCKDAGHGKDCFEYPVTSVFDAVRANCSDPDILQGKKLVLCYRLVFQFELATGVCYGMYKVCTMLLSVGSTLIMKINKNHIKRFKIAVAIIIFIFFLVALILSITFRSHPFLRLTASKFKIYFTILLGTVTALIIIGSMPWEEIIEEKGANTGEETENPAAESSVQSSETGGTGEGSRVQEVGLDNPIDPPQVFVLPKINRNIRLNIHSEMKCMN